MSDTLTSAEIVRIAVGEYLDGHPDRAGALVQEHSGGERPADLTQAALVAAGQVLAIVQEVAGDELVAALLASIGRLNAPRPELRAVVVETAGRWAEPGFVIVGRRAAGRMISSAGDMVLDAPMDAILALAAMVTQFDNKTDLVKLACARADRLVLAAEAPFRLVRAQVAGDEDAQRRWVDVLVSTGDPVDLMVRYFGLVHDLTGRTDALDDNPALDALASDIAGGDLETATAIARGFAKSVDPGRQISYSAYHLTRAVIEEAGRRDVPAGTVLDELQDRPAQP